MEYNIPACGVTFQVSDSVAEGHITTSVRVHNSLKERRTATWSRVRALPKLLLLSLNGDFIEPHVLPWLHPKWALLSTHQRRLIRTHQPSSKPGEAYRGSTLSIPELSLRKRLEVSTVCTRHLYQERRPMLRGGHPIVGLPSAHPSRS